ncbi:hypothetical protein ACLB2K_030351 [Fragaria x ananassa]
MVSNPTTSDETQNPDVEEALLAFEDYLGMIPRPPLCFFNEAMAYIADLKHYDVVIALFNRMGGAGIPYDIDTINLIFHCYLQLNQDMLAYVFLEQLLMKRGLQYNQLAKDLRRRQCLIRNNSSSVEHWALAAVAVALALAIVALKDDSSFFSFEMVETPTGLGPPRPSRLDASRLRLAR